MIERRKPLFALNEKHSNSSLGDDETELDLSLGSRSFLNRVNDQLRKRQKRSQMNVTEDSEKTFCDMENVHVFNIGIICFHGKELLRQLALHQEYTKDLTMKQMFDIGRVEIYGVNTIDWRRFFMEVFVFDW